MKCLAAMLLALWVSPCLADQSLALPVYWSPLLGLPSLQAIPSLLAKSDLPSVSFAKDSVIAQVSNCNDYFRLTQQGFSPANNMEIGVASGYVQRCKPLQLLAHAKAAKRSFIRGFDLSRDYMTLPARLIFPNLAEIGKPDGSLRVAVPDAMPDASRSGATSSQAINLISQKSDMQASVSLLALGDFSGQGLDEMLIFVANYTIDGTYHSYQTFLLTRRYDGAPLTQLGSP